MRNEPSVEATDREEYADDEYAANAEARTAIEKLNNEEITKLMLIAGSFVKKCYLASKGYEARDLFQEALKRTVAGTRRWRMAKVSFIKHLDETMRSISNEWVNQGNTLSLVQPLDGQQPLPEPVSTLTPEDELQGAELLDIIEDLFGDTPTVVQVIRLRVREYSKTEVMHELGMSDTQYETIAKRIRRAYLKNPNLLGGDK